MNSFVIGGLDTPEKKSEAEAILKELGYADDPYWNCDWREDEDCTFIATYNHGSYMYDNHNHDCQKPPITLEYLRTMKNQEK